MMNTSTKQHEKELFLRTIQYQEGSGGEAGAHLYVENVLRGQVPPEHLVGHKGSVSVQDELSAIIP